MRFSACLMAAAMTAATTTVAAAPEGPGTAAAPPAVAAPNWSQWQGRVMLGSPTAGAGRLGTASPLAALGSASLMGDYYFGRSFVPAGQSGGLRATSGLMIGPRAALALGNAARADGSSFSIARRTSSSAPPLTSVDPAAGEGPSATVPYLGLGYTGLSSRGGFSYSADLGIAGNPMRLGRPAGSGANLDDAVRDLRMAPLVQVGVSYAF